MYPIRQWNDELSSGLEEIISKCIQQNPEDRYQNCTDLMYALEHYTELDIEYRRQQKRKWLVFITSSILTMAATFGAAGFKFAELNLKQNSYNQYLADAKSTINKEEQIQLYGDAISIDPSKGEAYLELITNGFLDDNIFSTEEEEVLRKMLGTASGKSQTNESFLKANGKDYESFAYEASMAYFYYFENRGNKSGALKWLEIVSGSSGLQENKIERGKRLAKIAEYYSSIGLQNVAGDEAVTYLDYWNDLKELTEGNLVEIDNTKTALVMYGELLSQICDNCDKFKRAGISKKEILEQVHNVEKRLEDDIMIDNKGNNLMLEQEIVEMEANIINAKDMIALNYKDDGRKGGKADEGS